MSMHANYIWPYVSREARKKRRNNLFCATSFAPEIEKNRNENASHLYYMINHLPLADSFKTPAMIGFTDIGVEQSINQFSSHIENLTANPINFFCNPS